MSTTLDQKLSDDILATEGLRIFKNLLLQWGIVSTDFSAMTTQKGSIIKIPIVDEVKASNEENSYEKDTGNVRHVECPLDQYAHATFGLSDRQFAESSIASLNLFGQTGPAAVVQSISEYLLSILFSKKAECGTIEVNLSDDKGKKLVGKAQQILSENGLPILNRNMIMSPALENYVTEDNLAYSLASAIAAGKDNYQLNGSLPQMLGMGISMSNILPSVSDTDKFTGVALHKSALAMAVRAIQPSEGSAYAECRVVTDKETGISITYRRHYSPAEGKHYITYEAYFGGVIANPKAIVLIEDVATV